jgi:hypothetical protein
MTDFENWHCCVETKRRGIPKGMDLEIWKRANALLGDLRHTVQEAVYKAKTDKAEAVDRIEKAIEKHSWDLHLALYPKYNDVVHKSYYTREPSTGRHCWMIDPPSGMTGLECYIVGPNGRDLAEADIIEGEALIAALASIPRLREKAIAEAQETPEEVFIKDSKPDISIINNGANSPIVLQGANSTSNITVNASTTSITVQQLKDALLAGGASQEDVDIAEPYITAIADEGNKQQPDKENLQKNGKGLAKIIPFFAWSWAKAKFPLVQAFSDTVDYMKG